MNILLSHSYFLRFDAKAWRQMKPYPPLGTLYAASALRAAGHTVRLFDPMLAESEDSILPFLETERPDAVLFFEDNFNFLSKMCLTRMRQACFTMAGYAKKRGCIVIAQGSDPVDHLNEYFGNNVDVVIYGEGEHTAVELMRALEILPGLQPMGKHDALLSAINGIAFPARDGVRVTPNRPLIRELDALPFPAWDMVDIQAYRSAWMDRHGYFSMNLVTTRGCPYHCNWCSKPVYGQVYNSRSPENTAAELALLRERYAPDHIWFTDDILGLKPGWMQRYAEEVERLGVKTPFTCQTRADLLVKDGNAEAMARAGADTVWIGAESGAQSVLDAMDKGTTVDQILESTRLLQQNGVKVAWFLQFGYLGESGGDIERTLSMLRRGNPDDIGISVSYPLPGTKFYEMVKSTLERKQNWVDSGDLDLMYPGTFAPAYYRALHTYVHRSFRRRQGIRALLRLNFKRENRRWIALIPWNAAQALVASIRMALNMAPNHQSLAAGGERYTPPVEESDAVTVQ